MNNYYKRKNEKPIFEYSKDEQLQRDIVPAVNILMWRFMATGGAKGLRPDLNYNAVFERGKWFCIFWPMQFDFVTAQLFGYVQAIDAREVILEAGLSEVRQFAS